MSQDLCVGCTVEIFGLVSAAAHNGRKGVLEAYDEQKGRWGVRLVKSREFLGVKPENLKFIAAPENDRVVDDFEDRLAVAKRRFDKIRKKYGLDSDKVSGEIADLLTGREGGSGITAEDFAVRYKMPVEDAKAFLSFIQDAMEFKTQALDPHNSLAADLRKSMP